MRIVVLFVLVVAMTGLFSCGGGSQTLPVNNTPNTQIETDSQVGAPNQYATAFPDLLPQDSVQPWEGLGSDGKVVAATGASSDFYEGQQTHQEAGDTSAWNGALRMASGDVGAGNLSYAMYRIPLGGSEPGVVSVDANLRPMNDGNIGGYYVGLADYGNGSWQWFGPVTDAHWRVSSVQAARDGASYLTGIGNVFVCVVAHDGAAIDVVGVGVDPVDLGDTTAPDAPTGLVLTPVASGIELAWTAAGGSDVAGYKVYYNGSAFGEHTAQFANTVAGLQGRSFILNATNQTWVAVRAVDKSGNKSLLSTVESATPLAGTAPEISIDVTSYGVMRNEQVSLTATGADTYDWDTDGDGIFDIMGDNTGTADVDTSQTGLIRPLVRGTGSESTSIAMSAISVIVSSNARPVAFANASPSFGAAPLDVVFTGTESTDFDGSIVGGGWDFDGDGTFDVWDDTDIVHVSSANNIFTTPGTYNAKLKVVDNEGAWDVDTVAITVDTPPDPANFPPAADLTANVTSGDAPLTVSFTAIGSTDSDGTIVLYRWDWDGNGGYEESSRSPSMSHRFTSPGSSHVAVMVEDNDGSTDVALLWITVNVAGNELPVAAISATPDTGDFPIEIDFDAQASNDPDGSIVRYDYDFDGDDNFELYDGTDSPDWEYTSPGVFDAQVRVTDNNGAQDVSSVQVTINVPGNDSPTAALSATPASGDTPLDVTLDASGSNDPDGSIVNYEWDFDGDGTYDSYGSGNSVDHTYTSADVYTAKVRVTDDAGAQATATVVVTVNASPVAILQGSPLTGTDSIDVAFSAADSFDPDGTIEDYEWDFDGDGTYNEAGAEADSQGEAAPALQTYSPGILMSSVRVTDDDGATNTASLTVTVHGWATPFALDTADSVGKYTSLMMVDGYPAICYFDVTNLDLKYVRATDASGSSWGTPVAVDTTGDVGWYTSMELVDGNPAISYKDGVNSDLLYVRATDAQGSSWGTPVVVDLTGNNEGAYNSLAVVDGYPAISYGDNTLGNLKYVRATDAQGGSWGTPIVVDSFGNVAWHTSLAIVDGNPAISYYEQYNTALKYVRATDAQGGSWGTPVLIDAYGVAGQFTSLVVVDGNPAVSYYYDNDSNDGMRYVRATDAQGGSWGTPVTIDEGRGVGRYTSLAVVDGNPAISYYDDTNDDLKYVRATDASGSTWGTRLALDTAGDVGLYTSLAVVDGNPAISYYDATNGDLKYVRYY